jgi:hypothetical protein
MLKTTQPILIFILLLCQFSFGQVNINAYKKYEYHWKEPKPEPIKVEAAFSKENVVYLTDQNVIVVGRQNEANLKVLYQRKARLKFLTADGVKKYSTISIPESLDPLYDYHETPFKNNAIKKAPPYYDMRLNWFAARITKADGTVISAEYADEYKEEDVLSMIMKLGLSYKYFTSHYWNFVFKNIEPGDELEYDYEVEIPFLDNFYRFYSVRAFFNGEEPKQNYSLVFKYKFDEAHTVKFMNNGEPDSVNIIDKMKCFYWTKKNLAGCLDETGSRGYTTLPYIIYSIDTESDSFVYNDAITAERKIMPFWTFILRFRESYDYTMRRNAAVKMFDRQNSLVKEFIKQCSAGIADSLKYARFTQINTVIADSFKYVFDDALFREEDSRKERIGDFVTERKIREISRYKLYAKLLNEVGLDYFTLYLMDNRYGKIDTSYISPVWNTEYLYAIYLDKNFALVHPKKSDNGWYMEELPFYWESSSGLLLNYNDLNINYLEKPRILKTSASSLNDNTRKSNIMVNVDLDNLTTSFDARISLTGQYSTITRFMYLGNSKDSIDNPLYNKKISDIDANAKVKSTEVTGRKNIFPYKFDVRTTYDASDILSKAADGSVTLSIKGWFNHIIYDHLVTENRQLDFYPDFVGQDSYRYMIKFNKPVEIIAGSQTIDLANSFGKLSIKFSQPQPDEIFIESYFITTAEKVAAEKINDVAEIYKAVSNLNAASLQIKY